MKMKKPPSEANSRRVTDPGKEPSGARQPARRGCPEGGRRQTCRVRSGQESAEAIVVGDTSRSADEHVKIAGGLTQRRAELYGSVLTAWWTVNPPKTPECEVEPRVVMMGSMWALRSGLRPVPHAGSSRVRAEPPDTDPYVRWCGTRGWLSWSVTGTRFGPFGGVIVCIDNFNDPSLGNSEFESRRLTDPPKRLHCGYVFKFGCYRGHGRQPL